MNLRGEISSCVGVGRRDRRTPCPIAGVCRVPDAFWSRTSCRAETTRFRGPMPRCAFGMDILKTRTKLLAGFHASLLVGTALVLLTGTAPASAHTPQVDPTCTGVTVTLANYAETAEEPTPNALTVTVDGEEVENVTFGATFSGQFDFADTTIGHDYTVTVDAPGTTYDRYFEGTTEACVAPPVPADAAAAVHIVPPSCDVPARLVLDEAVHATWSTPTAVTGPADYSVVATADAGHVFATGEKIATFTGRLDGQLDSVEAGCATSPETTPPKPEPVVTSESVDDEDCTTDTITTTTTTVSTGWVLDEASNTWLATQPVTTVTTADRESNEQECPTPAGTNAGGVVELPSTPADTNAGVVSELPSTGADSGWLFAVAGTLLAAGAALVLVRRTRQV